MLWWLCRINKAWHASIGQSLEWQALEVVKSENPSYHQIVKWLCFKKHFLKKRLQFEVEYLKYYLHMQNLMEPKEQDNSWFL
jgi:hypothetical protein